MIVFDEEFKQIKQILGRLRIDANAKMVFLVDRSGQHLASEGDVADVDVTSLSSLTAGNVAATDGLAKLLGEKEFNGIFHEGAKENLHISLVGDKVVLVVAFDERSSLGLVRLRVKKAAIELLKVLEIMDKKSEKEKETFEAAGFESPFAEITDEDIDSLFSE